MFCFFLLLAGFQLERRVKPISAPLSSSIPKTVSLDQMKPIYMVGHNVSQIGGQIFFFTRSLFTHSSKTVTAPF